MQLNCKLLSYVHPFCSMLYILSGSCKMCNINWIHGCELSSMVGSQTLWAVSMFYSVRMQNRFFFQVFRSSGVTTVNHLPPSNSFLCTLFSHTNVLHVLFQYLYPTDTKKSIALAFSIFQFHHECLVVSMTCPDIHKFNLTCWTFEFEITPAHRTKLALAIGLCSQPLQKWKFLIISKELLFSNTLF